MLSLRRVIASPALAPRALAGAMRTHCQVPCGIFDDPARVEALKEDAATVRKAMVQIAELGTGTPLAVNQVRAAQDVALALHLPFAIRLLRTRHSACCLRPCPAAVSPDFSLWRGPRA